MELVWEHLRDLPSKSYTCGNCGHALASAKGFIGSYKYDGNKKCFIYICHHCFKPTFFSIDKVQTPGPIFGKPIKFIPDKSVDDLYNEARACYTINAFTSSVMCCRKLLMNIAVKEGAKEKDNFVNYVNYLNNNAFIPPKGKAWVDAIRKLGNEANHSIEFKTETDAKLILTFTEMLLRFIYEMPGLMEESNPKEVNNEEKKT